MAASSLLHYSTASPLFSISKTQTHHHYYKPLKASLSQNQTSCSWSAINSEVEAHIQHALTGKQPASVYDPMNHLIFEVPRSMAPALCIAACEAVGGQKEEAIAAASAVHLMHVATYTHEYLQLSDTPLFTTTAKHTYGPNVELITADSMVPLGYELLALAAMDDSSPTSSNADRILRVMGEIGQAAGAEGMVSGQYMKLKSMGLEGDDGDESSQEKMIYEAFEKKGGALYSCGAACGAILGGGSDEEIEKLRNYGLYVGMIHNIMVYHGLAGEKRLIKLADSLRFLALKELEGMKDANIERISSIIDGFSAFLRVQKYQFPQRV